MAELFEFEWDPSKAVANSKKHGVSFLEATTAFDDALSLTEEERGPQGEVRMYTVGRSRAGRLLVVVHTDRTGSIRIISARLASRRERKAYEEGT